LSQGVSIGLLSLGLVMALVLLLDFLNAYREAANAVMTVVSTGALTPNRAVLVAALFNALAYFVIDFEVAANVAKQTVNLPAVNAAVMLSAVVSALIWLCAAWKWRLPFSGAHALLGGLLGAAAANGGIAALIASGTLKIIVFAFVAPLLAMLLTSVVVLACAWSFRRSQPRIVEKWFGRLQLLSFSISSMARGANEAQKAVGFIWLALMAGGQTALSEARVPAWVAIVCYAVFSLGTLFGGWRVIKTMGQRLSKLRPVDGFAAETGSALALGLAAHYGLPVSTAHSTTGAIVGTSASLRVKAVHVAVATDILWAGVLTIPLCGITAAAFFWMSRFI
jgi:inorganic phosphate transporter, PiT family